MECSKLLGTSNAGVLYFRLSHSNLGNGSDRQQTSSSMQKMGRTSFPRCRWVIYFSAKPSQQQYDGNNNNNTNKSITYSQTIHFNKGEWESFRQFPEEKNFSLKHFHCYSEFLRSTFFFFLISDGRCG